jgi:hypothetical protein
LLRGWQNPLAQSPDTAQRFPVEQRAHVPPQSTSVSVQFFRRSVHVAHSPSQQWAVGAQTLAAAPQFSGSDRVSATRVTLPAASYT